MKYLFREILGVDVDQVVKQVVAPYKYPRAIEFVAALPRTETGKLQRFKLRQLCAARGSAREREA